MKSQSGKAGLGLSVFDHFNQNTTSRHQTSVSELEQTSTSTTSPTIFPKMSSPQPSKNASNIAIVGGGIAGVLLTIALLKHCPHFQLTLYESASALGEIGAGVGFQPVMVRTMALIDPRIAVAFEKCIQGNEEMDQPIWFTVRVGDARKKGVQVGEEVFRILGRSGPRGGVHRAHFLAELVKLIPDGVAVFGKRVVDVSKAGDGSGMLRFCISCNKSTYIVKAMQCCTLQMKVLLSIRRCLVVMASNRASVPLYSPIQIQRQQCSQVNTRIVGWCQWTKQWRSWAVSNHGRHSCILGIMDMCSHFRSRMARS